jgi:regulator of protease activity HflC (stomatin/prohibitin superfamily)
MDDKMEERFPQVRIPRVRIPATVTVIAIVLIVLIAGTLFFSFSRVNVGNVAVIIDPILGTISSEGDGSRSYYFFKTPWASSKEIYVATDSIHMWTDRDKVTGQITYGDFPAVSALTRDGLGVEVDITVRWSLAPGTIVELYKKYPVGDWKDRAIIPIVRRAIRDTVVQFTAIATIEERDAVAVEFERILRIALSEETSLVNSTILGSIDLREIALPMVFVEAIEAKLAAEQLAIAAEFNKTKILVLANATAQAAILEAQGIATSRIVVADATYESLQIIAGEAGVNSTELTSLYLTLEALKDMAQTGNVTFLIVSGETGTWILPVP